MNGIGKRGYRLDVLCWLYIYIVYDLVMDPSLTQSPSNEQSDVSEDGLPVQDGFAVREREATQQALFPIEEVVLPPSLSEMRKPVAIIHAVPVLSEGQEMTLNMRRLQNACITLAQNDLAQREKAEPGLLRRILQEQRQPLFETTIGKLADLAHIEGNNYERIYEALYRLQDQVFMWNVLGEDNEVAWLKRAHFLSNVSRGVGPNRGMLRFRFDFDVLEIVLEPHLWAKFSLNPNSFGTSASLALYENCWRYIGTASKRTASMPVQTWIELLCGTGKYMTRDAQGRQRPNYGEFKRSVLNDSIKRVNAVSALKYSLRLIEHKAGNRVTHLQFAFEPKKQQTLGLPLMWQGDLTNVLVQLGFSEKEIADLGEAYQQEEVREGLARLKEAQDKIRAAGRSITSRKAYLLGILANLTSSKKGQDLDLDAVEREVRTREAEQMAEERRRRTEEGFNAHQARVFAENYARLDSARRAEIETEYLSSPEGKRLLSTLESSGGGFDASRRMHQHLLRTWMKGKRPLDFAELLPNPEDRSLDAWLEWRLEMAQSGR